MCCEEKWGPCKIGPLACEASRLIAERQGIEDSRPRRWRAIDHRIDAIEIEAGEQPAISRAGQFLQACIGAGDATGETAKAALTQLTRSLDIPSMAPLRAYYVGPEKEPAPDDSALPQDR